MFVGHYSFVPLKQGILILLLYNYVCQCTFMGPISGLIFNKLTTYKGVGLPKSRIFTDDEISRNKNLYLAGKRNEDIYLNGTQLIVKYGYKVEEHQVITSDGYILTLYRIPGKGRTVFLMHGILSSFVDWLTAGPDQGLAYVLADQGYDVWMGNARGNTFSRKHVRLSPSKSKFWKFSFNEIGSKDLPAMIDYVLEKTGRTKITYIGHSQGTSTFFVLCSVRPEYNKKIEFMIALSAVAWMKHMPNPIFQIASSNHVILYALGRVLGVNEIAPDSDLKKALTLTLCGESTLASIVCQNVLFLIAGFDYSQINYKQLPVISNHTPAGCSLTQLEHYAQLVLSGYFRNFDHGSRLNLKIYGSTSPPSYPVQNITVPIAIFQSQGDWLASTIDVNNLRKKLKNVVDYYKIPLKSFNHVDYLWAKDVKKLVYDRVLTLLKKH